MPRSPFTALFHAVTRCKAPERSEIGYVILLVSLLLSVANVVYSLVMLVILSKSDLFSVGDIVLTAFFLSMSLFTLIAAVPMMRQDVLMTRYGQFNILVFLSFVFSVTVVGLTVSVSLDECYRMLNYGSAGSKLTAHDLMESRVFTSAYGIYAGGLTDSNSTVITPTEIADVCMSKLPVESKFCSKLFSHITQLAAMKSRVESIILVNVFLFLGQIILFLIYTRLIKNGAAESIQELTVLDLCRSRKKDHSNVQDSI
jgi:hypothetical protein